MAAQQPINLYGGAAVRMSNRSAMLTLVHTNNNSPIRWRNTRTQGNQDFSGHYIFPLTTAYLVPHNLTAASLGAAAVGQQLTQLGRQVRACFGRCITYVKLAQRLGTVANSQMMMGIHDDNYHMNTPMMPTTQMNPDRLMVEVMRLLQSSDSIDLDSATIDIYWVKPIAGGAHFKAAADYEAFSKKKRCVTQIRSVDNDCFYQALYLFLQPQGSYHRQAARVKGALALREEANLHPHGTMVPLSDMGKLEDIFTITIRVVRFIGMHVVYNGSRKPNHDTSRPQMWLLMTMDPSNEAVAMHYDLVSANRIGALWSKRAYCLKCEYAYDDQNHKCVRRCYACHTRECTSGADRPYKEANLPCEKCGRKFFSRDCHDRHKGKECSRRRKCPTCPTIIIGKMEHQCGMYKCKNCKDWFAVRADVPHECFHQPLKDEDLPKPNTKLIFYDYESTLDSHHEPALVVAEALDSEEVLMFDTNDEFVDWIFNGTHSGYTFIAHNGGRYDFHFIKAAMMRRGIKSVDIAGGNTIFESVATDFKVRFIDSWRFTLCSLRAFPKTFGLTEQAKGHFPYTFFTTANRHYKGPMPPIEHFAFDMLKPRDRKEGIEWYTEHKDDIIDLDAMCKAYCASDVKLLKNGCKAYRELFLMQTGGKVDPFQFITIASVCMAIYQNMFLKPGQIGILNAGKDDPRRWAYRNWLHAQYEGLVDDYVTEAGVKVDIWDPATQRAYVYLSCVDHGCRECTFAHAVHPVSFETNHLLRLETLKHYRNTVVMWGCEWDKVAAEAVTAPAQYPPLKMRDAFFGGRTEPMKLYVKAKPDERIAYADFTSLYPSVQSNRSKSLDPNVPDRQLFYPIGHPTPFYNVDPATLDGYFGFVRCHVVPPQGLHIPLLPERRDGKLIFDLRPKWGTWTTIEVLKAAELGYRVTEISEIQHFERQSLDLFADYVAMWLKVKQEAAGWSKLGCHTPEEQEAFVTDYEREMGIAIDPTKVAYNPGMYAIAKLCLNSLWGKFAQRSNFGMTVDTYTPEGFDELMYDQRLEIVGVIMHPDSEARTVTHKLKDMYVGPSGKKNIAVAAYTTAYGRLRLYEALELTGQDTIYMDTDSVIYMDKGQLPMGPYLGDLTNELDEGDYITEFVTTGPKSYAYKTASGKTEVKVKGFTLNHQALETLNMATMRHMVCHDHQATVMTRPLQFVINRDHGITTKDWGPDGGKTFGFTYNKRRVVIDGDDNTTINTLAFN